MAAATGNGCGAGTDVAHAAAQIDITSSNARFTFITHLPGTITDRFDVDRERLDVAAVADVDELLLLLDHSVVVLKGYRNAHVAGAREHAGRDGDVQRAHDVAARLRRFDDDVGGRRFLRGGFGAAEDVARFRSPSSSAMMSTDERTLTCFTSGAAFVVFSVWLKSISGSGAGGAIGSGAAAGSATSAMTSGAAASGSGSRFRRYERDGRRRLRAPARRR